MKGGRRQAPYNPYKTIMSLSMALPLQSDKRREAKREKKKVIRRKLFPFRLNRNFSTAEAAPEKE